MFFVEIHAHVFPSRYLLVFPSQTNNASQGIKQVLIFQTFENLFQRSHQLKSTSSSAASVPEY